MPDREKVIKGLKYLHDVKRWSPDESEESITARRNITGDALALLKAQEPRVMTREEYEAWIDTPFTERNPVFHEERTKRGTVTCWVNTVVCSLSEYGKNDRCWTSRPDEKRRVETPWN